MCTLNWMCPRLQGAWRPRPSMCRLLVAIRVPKTNRTPWSLSIPLTGAYAMRSSSRKRARSASACEVRPPPLLCHWWRPWWRWLPTTALRAGFPLMNVRVVVWMFVWCSSLVVLRRGPPGRMAGGQVPEARQQDTTSHRQRAHTSQHTRELNGSEPKTFISFYIFTLAISKISIGQTPSNLCWCVSFLLLCVCAASR